MHPAAKEKPPEGGSQFQSKLLDQDAINWL
jgi:hypothetical protein